MQLCMIRKVHVFSWEQMEWNVTGDVTGGSVITEELCSRYFYDESS